jgi:hypothetical protein
VAATNGHPLARAAVEAETGMMHQTAFDYSPAAMVTMPAYGVAVALTLNGQMHKRISHQTP